MVFGRNGRASSRLLNIMPGTNKEYKMYQLVAFLEAIAKEDGHDLGWEHKNYPLLSRVVPLLPTPRSFHVYVHVYLLVVASN